MSKYSCYGLILGFGLGAGFLFLEYLSFNKRLVLPIGQFAPSAPTQFPIIDVSRISLESEDAFVQKMAVYDIRAKVLEKKYYSDDTFSKYSPVDLALGWREFSDEGVIKNYKFSQSGRWYFYEPVDEHSINYSVIDQSANVHIVPASLSLEKEINLIEPGSIIRLKGYLVNVVDSENVWRTSLSRFDTGAGSCEILYVKSVEVLISTER